MSLSLNSNIYAVFGYPILHSLSPQIYDFFFKKDEKDAVYLRISAKNSKELFELSQKLKLAGYNVTAPLKNSLKRVVIKNEKIDAINCVKIENGKSYGYNTDIFGIEKSLEKSDFVKRDIILLGAGGAADAILYVLKKKGVNSVSICNRNLEKAEILSKKYNYSAYSLNFLDKLIVSHNMLINTIPVDILSEKLKHFPKNYLFFDAVYKNSFLKRAKDAGYKIIDGKIWLFYQALKSYSIFMSEDMENLEKRFKDRKFKAHKIKNIGFIGFMGVGKTTMGKMIARKLNWDYIDTDELIKKKTGKSIPKIFEENGEEYFRKIEKEVLSELINCERKVISYGGGILEDSDNRKIVDEISTNIWIYTSFNTVLERIHNRPLFKGGYKKLNERFEKRFIYYAKTSDLVVDGDEKNENELFERIFYEIDSIFNS